MSRCRRTSARPSATAGRTRLPPVGFLAAVAPQLQRADGALPVRGEEPQNFHSSRAERLQ